MLSLASSVFGAVLRILLHRVLRTDLERRYFLLLQENRILKAKARRPVIREWDRRLLAAIGQASRMLLDSLVVVRPETVLGWHRALVRLKGRWAQNRPGRPPIPENTRRLLVEMKKANPRWGVQRISGELKKLGFKVSKKTVARLLKWEGFSPKSKRAGQGWFRFLKNQKNRIYACDFFQVHTVFLERLSVFFIMDIHSKAIVHFVVTKTHSLEWFRNHIRSVFAFMDVLPKYLVADNDRAYGIWMKPMLMEDFGVQVLHTPKFKPWFNCYAERLVRTLRDELTDRILIYNERDLHAVLSEYVRYYNQGRSHSSREGCAPISRGHPRKAAANRVVRTSVLDGLIVNFERAA